jgi:hypothetical protein
MVLKEHRSIAEVEPAVPRVKAQDPAHETGAIGPQLPSLASLVHVRHAFEGDDASDQHRVGLSLRTGDHIE